MAQPNGDADEMCPAPVIFTMIGGKWKLSILKELIFHGTKRFGALRRDIERFVRDNRLGCTSGALARLMRGLFGEKPLPWASAHACRRRNRRS